jgi:hypothetical protein
MRRCDEPPPDLWLLEGLARFPFGMRARQADVLDQVGSAADQARQLTTIATAPPPRREDGPDRGEPRRQPAAAGDPC